MLDVKLYDSKENKYISTNLKLTRVKKSYKQHWVKKITKDFYIYKDIFCYADYINYEYNDHGDKIVTSADLVITRIQKG